MITLGRLAKNAGWRQTPRHRLGVELLEPRALAGNLIGILGLGEAILASETAATSPGELRALGSSAPRAFRAGSAPQEVAVTPGSLRAGDPLWEAEPEAELSPGTRDAGQQAWGAGVSSVRRDPSRHELPLDLFEELFPIEFEHSAFVSADWNMSRGQMPDAPNPLGQAGGTNGGSSTTRLPDVGTALETPAPSGSGSSLPSGAEPVVISSDNTAAEDPESASPVLAGDAGGSAALSSGATYYVDANAGDDAAAGSAESPFRTLEHALATVTGGDTIVLSDGQYGSITGPSYPVQDMFDDWVTIRAAENAEPVIASVRLGAVSGVYFDEDGRGAYDAYLRIEGVSIADGVLIYGGNHMQLIDCRIEREGPWTGSRANIQKVAVLLNAADGRVENCEITNTAIGINLTGWNMEIVGNHIHHIAHDGIRVIALKASLIEGNHIHYLDDGVDDGDPAGIGWNQHCDGIHIFIPGPGTPGLENRDLVFRGNVIYDVESQGVQFNNYYQTPDVHNANITFENNIFGPTVANAFNLAAPVDGFVFRNNTFIQVPGGRVFGRLLAANTRFSVHAGSTGVEIYNNILDFPLLTIQEDWFFQYNLIQRPTARLPSGRFDVFGADPLFVDANAMDGRIAAESPAVDAGTRKFAPTPSHPTDIYGTLHDNRPDMGAVEIAGRSPEAEQDPPAATAPIYRFSDDFADGNYYAVDPWLSGENTKGLAWQHIAGKPYGVEPRSGDNELVAAMSPGVAMIVAAGGAGWSDYDFAFAAHNQYLAVGGGPVFLVADSATFYWLDISRDHGALMRSLPDELGHPSLVELAAEPSLELPHFGVRSYLVQVRHEADAIAIAVDADRDGTIELVYRDTSPAALAALGQGAAGFRRDTTAQYHRIYYDEVQITLASQ